MAQAPFRFERFELDADDRILRCDGRAVELNARYLDALILLVREQGRLVSKARFLDEVWRGVPVTDEALTQCIRTLRRQLGDDAVRPRFIETAPKHGYRFIAPVEQVAAVRGAHTGAQPMPEASALADADWRPFFLQGAAGAMSGGVAGAMGGLLYGSIGLQTGGGAISSMLVLVCLTLLVGIVGGAGVGFGIAVAGIGQKGRGVWSIAGAAGGGLAVGAVVKLIGLDAFDLLFGQSPGEITGAFEGLLLGAAVGTGAWLAERQRMSARRAALTGGLITMAAGAVIPLAGGRLMAGSLMLLAERFPHSRLRLDQISAVWGETGFGLVSQVVTAGAEGLLFGGFVVGFLVIARRRLDRVGKP